MDFEELLNEDIFPNEEEDVNVGLDTTPVPNSKAQALIQAAKELGVDPRDLAASMSYETGGKFDPNMWGGKGGNYMGLIQFGPNERKQYGAAPGQTFEEQIPAVVRYLKGRGLQPGSDISAIYRTINGGNPNASLNASDGNGTIAQHIERIKAQHYPNADKFLQGLIDVQARQMAKPAPGTTQYTAEGEDWTPPTPTVEDPKLADDVSHMLEQLRPTEAPIELPELTPEQVQQLEQPYIGPQVNMQPATPWTSPWNDPEVMRQFLINRGVETANMPQNLMAMLEAPVFAFQGKENPWKTSAEANAEAIRKMVGLEAPKTAEQTAAANVAKGAGPMLGPLGEPLNLAIGAGGALLDNVISPANALDGVRKEPSKKTKKQQETDAAIGNTGAFLKQSMLYNPNLTMFTPQERTAINTARKNIVWTDTYRGLTLLPVNGKYYITPRGESGSPQGDMEEANKYGLNNFPVYSDLTQAQNALTRMENLLAPDVERKKITLNTEGGPQQFDLDQILKYGAAAAVTTGALIAPAVIGRFRTGRIPSLVAREVPDVLPGVAAVTTAGDYAHATVHDVTSPMMAVARRMGVDEATLTNLNKKFNIETNSGAQTLADAFVYNGDMRGVNFKAHVSVPMAELNKADNPQFSQYLHAQNIVDQFMEAQTLNAWATQGTYYGFTKAAAEKVVAKGKKTQGFDQAERALESFARRENEVPTTIRGLTEQQARQLVADMEAASIIPGSNRSALEVFRDKYNENIKELRRFEASGEFALITKEEQQLKNATRQTYIPGLDKQLGQPVDVGSVTHMTSEHIRARMKDRLENEVKGLWVDAVKDIDVGNGQRVVKKFGGTEEEWARNPKLQKNSFTVYRRGVPEHYSTDPFIADLMRMDPYMLSGMSKNILNGPARLFMSGTTGELAPWFAATSFFRNQKLMRTSTLDGLKSTNVLASAWAIPKQLAPQIAKSISNSLDRGSNGWLRSFMGDANVDGMSTWLMSKHNESLYAALEAGGTHYGSIMQQQKLSNKMLDQAMQNVEPSYREAAMAVARNLRAGYNATLQATHNAPAFAFANKNKGKLPPAELAYEARRLTGNPMAQGQYYTNQGKPIRFVPEKGVVGKAKYGAARAAGAASEFGRTAVPWFNTTIQGNKRLIQAYAENPAKFVGKVWLYSQVPAIASYALMQSAGTDPNGRSYADYWMSRSPWERAMNTYIAIPGQPVEKGIKIPNVHEFSYFSMMTMQALHHATRSNVFSYGEDMKQAAGHLLNVFMPANPAVINAGFGLAGMSPPHGLIPGMDTGGGAYTPKQDAFNQYNSGIPQGLETFARAIAPGIADVGIQAITAATNSEDILSGTKNFAKAGARSAIEKAPVVRDVFGMQPGQSGNIPVMSEMYDKKKEIDRLLGFHARNTKEVTKGPKAHDEGEYGLGGASKSGAELQGQFYYRSQMANKAGLAQPAPTNPLYDAFIEKLQNSFKRDSVSSGGMGFQTAMDDLKIATDQLAHLKKVNEGTHGIWLGAQASKPDVTAELEKFGVNPRDHKAVVSYFRNRQYEIGKHLLTMINAVENDMTKEARQRGLIKPNQSITFKDLQPFKEDTEVDPSTEKPGE